MTITNAYHHRSDSLSSLAATVALTGSMFGFNMLDPIGGVIVSGMILKAAYGFENIMIKI